MYILYLCQHCCKNIRVQLINNLILSVGHLEFIWAQNMEVIFLKLNVFHMSCIKMFTSWCLHDIWHQVGPHILINLNNDEALLKVHFPTQTRRYNSNFHIPSLKACFDSGSAGSKHYTDWHQPMLRATSRWSSGSWPTINIQSKSKLVFFWQGEM